MIELIIVDIKFMVMEFEVGDYYWCVCGNFIN